jgi:hypothetical protein
MFDARRKEMFPGEWLGRSKSLSFEGGDSRLLSECGAFRRFPLSPLFQGEKEEPSPQPSP